MYRGTVVGKHWAIIHTNLKNILMRGYINNIFVTSDTSQQNLTFLCDFSDIKLVIGLHLNID